MILVGDVRDIDRGEICVDLVGYVHDIGGGRAWMHQMHRLAHSILIYEVDKSDSPQRSVAATHAYHRQC